MPASRSQARQWSRSAWMLALLFASLPLASRLLLGEWDFDGATGIAGVCLVLGTYFYFLGRPRSHSVPDPATIMDRAIQLASEGRIEDAQALLTDAIRLSPRLWQAVQYRGELYLAQGDFAAALRDFTEAIRLAPEEQHLYTLRDRAQGGATEPGPTEP